MSNNFLVIKQSVIGRDHIAKNMENQDSIYSEYNIEKGINICAVADGHGDKSHPFSRIGSEKAVNIITSLFDIDDPKEIKRVIIKKWREEIFKDAKKNIDKVLDHINVKSWKSYSLNLIFDNFDKLTDENDFYKDIKYKFIERWIIKGFPSKRKLTFNEYIKHKILRLYGTTLLVVKANEEFTEIFQLGDGDITFLDNKNSYHRVFKSNKKADQSTDSLCMESAEDFFMYKKIKTDSYSMLSLSTDGLLDSLNEKTGGKYLFLDFKKLIIDNPNHFETKELRTKLEEITNNGSKGDDTSIIILFKKSNLNTEIVTTENSKISETDLTTENSKISETDLITDLTTDLTTENSKISEISETDLTTDLTTKNSKISETNVTTETVISDIKENLKTDDTINIKENLKTDETESSKTDEEIKE